MVVMVVTLNHGNLRMPSVKKRANIRSVTLWFLIKTSSSMPCCKILLKNNMLTLKRLITLNCQWKRFNLLMSSIE
ncbi:hypothetical protein K1719_000402 [Acacia pycnantha]|nr:hypothetical protein K1719_000402 [Acacia pycnantha]